MNRQEGVQYFQMFLSPFPMIFVTRTHKQPNESCMENGMQRHLYYEIQNKSTEDEIYVYNYGSKENDFPVVTLVIEHLIETTVETEEDKI